MIERNLLQPPETPQAAYDLEAWDPVVLDPADQVVFEPLLDSLNTVSVMHVPGEKGLYAVSDDRVSYAVASPNMIRTRELSLSNEFAKPMPPHSAFSDKMMVDQSKIPQEALARATHIMLGRACLRQGALSDNARQFSQASRDLVKVLGIAKRSAYPLHNLNDSLNANGLLYMFKQAAMHFKTISTEDAKVITSGIGRVVGGGERWFSMSAPHLARSIGYKDSNLNRKPSDETVREVPELDLIEAFKEELSIGEDDTIVYREQAVKNYADDFKKFAALFPETISHQGTQEELLNILHKKYANCRRSRMPVPLSRDREKIANAAVRSYLVAQSDQNKTAGNILKALSEYDYKSTYPLIIAGNFAFQKLRKPKDQKAMSIAPNLGFDDTALPGVFSTLHEAVRVDRTAPPETEVSIQLGELVANYLKISYA